MNWSDDPIFLGEPDDPWRVSQYSRPAFRLSILSSYERAHPFIHGEAWQALFDCFSPILKNRCDRLLMIEKPGGSPRRRKSIIATDWRPFDHMRSVIPADDGHWIGFWFQSGGNTADGYVDYGPTLFNFWVGTIVQADITIPVDALPHLDMEAVRKALCAIPYGTAVGGYGLSLSEAINNGSMDEFAENLIPIARKFPALDICHNGFRYWFADYEYDLSTYWLAGVNWLTGVGEPFLSALGGAAALKDGLPPGIRAEEGNRSMLFQLGARPVTGQAGTADGDLSLFHALGARLKPRGWGWPSEKKPPNRIFGEGHDTESLAWFRRFYDGPTADWWR